MGFRVRVAIFLVFAWMTVHLTSSQTGVCHQTVSSMQTYQVYVSVSNGYTYSCGFLWLYRCGGTRYRSQAVLRTRAIYHDELVCCTGYTGDGSQCDPICTNCVEPGMCVAPDMCVCPAGWTGNQCLNDIDECVTDVCEHNCNNTLGSYYCICTDGSILDSNQPSCIESPQISSVNATSSTSLVVSWKHPNLEEMDGEVETFAVSCSPGDIAVSAPADSLSAELLHLSPYTTYTCCVTAHTTAGVSGASCGTQTTLEDVPSDSPVNITVTAVSPFAVEIEWRSPTTPNGIIVKYTVYTNNSIIVILNGSQTNYLYHGLLPYEEVNISVSARTEIGEGPRSIEVHSRAQESVPSVVKSLTVIALSANLLRVSWEPPLSPNGVLTGYQVHMVNLINYTEFRFNRSRDQFEVESSDGIGPYVPYSISVSAKTRIGVGEPRETVVFTLEGIPLKAPPIVLADRTEATTALIEWEILSQEDLRGNLSSHEIVYFNLLEAECPPTTIGTSSSRMVSFIGTEPQFVISDLDPGLQYCVGVAAKTGAGLGDFSYSLIPWYSNSLFTVLLLEIPSCAEWIVTMPSEKVEDLVQEISKSIAEYCQCNIPTNYIADGKFTCGKGNPEFVIFQGRLISTNDRDSAYLVGDLEEWVSSEPTIMVQGKNVRVVSSETSPDPSTDEQQEDRNLSWTVTGSVVAVVGSLLLIGSTLFGVFCYRKRSQRLKEIDLSPQAIAMNTLSVKTSPQHLPASNPVLKNLKNPFYGYGTHEQPGADAGAAEYSEVPKQSKPGDEEKDIKNPLYGYGKHEQSGADDGAPMYSEVPRHSKPGDEEIANPIYGVQEHKMLTSDDLISNPLYGCGKAQPQNGTGGVESSSSGLYAEVPASREVPIYDAPACD